MDGIGTTHGPGDALQRRDAEELPVKLIELIAEVETLAVEGDANVEIARVRADSREVEEGDLFVATRGTRHDSHASIDEAIARGAVAVVVEGDVRVPAARAVVRVASSRRALGRIAAAAHGWPSRRLTVVGITGTNGKTTTSYLLESVLREAGLRPGTIGTVGYRYGDREVPAKLTTPDALTLQALLADMASRGATHVLLEVSSIALEQERVAGCELEVALYTNLSQDHLDLHGTMEAYFEAKALMFSAEGPAGAPRHAVLNRDDPWASQLADRCDAPVLTYGTGPFADLATSTHLVTRAGIRTRIETPSGSIDVSSPLVGHHNLQNLLAAATVATVLGVPRDAIERGLARVKRIPGRLERVRPSTDVDVLVDYAHTPEALDKVLEAVRSLAGGRVITVFGCGGDRDRSKRARMGRAASDGSDLVVLTSDNPRSEDPRRILADIEEALDPSRRRDAGQLADAPRGSYAVVPDRREAIHAAIAAARPGDLVLIAGKGHETTQKVGNEELPFDDREVAAEALRGEAAGDGGAR